MRIPLPKMLRHWREREYERHLKPARESAGLKLWAFAARHPTLYRIGVRMAAWALVRMARGKGRIGSLPLAGGWTGCRDMPAPTGGTFVDQWKAGR